MEDYLNYISALNEVGGVMNQVTSAREMVEQKVEEKKQEYGIPSEMIAETAGIYLGKKVLGMVAEKFGGDIANVASKVGISAETTAKALSGDVEGALQGAAADIQATVSGAVSGAVEQATAAVSGAVSSGLEQATAAVSGGLEEATAAVSGAVSTGLEQATSAVSGLVSSISPVSIEQTANDLYEGTMSDLASQAQMEIGALRQYTNIGLETMGRNVATDTSNVGDIELTDFSNVGTDIGTTAEATTAGATTAAETGTVAAEAGATAGAEAGATAGATIGEAVATGGLEAAAAGLSATGVLAPLAGILGLIGGIVGIFEEHKSEPEPIIPVLNPSSQYL